ncbi:ATP-binding protein [Streptomyces sp. NPDC050535]|uniref:ATP-binding protein n=1 Tax=Streptomyces sp. NPDC050535 TaxID=3365626 RepID=UPI003789C6EC
MAGTWQIRWLLPAKPATVGCVRRRAAAQLTAWGLAIEPWAHQVLALVISELVTNAVQHGGGLTITVGLGVHRHQMTVEVWDDDATTRARTATDAQDRGLGLDLVTALASDWGTRPTFNGKSVWATLPLPENLRQDPPPRRRPGEAPREDPASHHARHKFRPATRRDPTAYYLEDKAA